MDLKEVNLHVITEYRRTGGVLSGQMSGLPVLLLTTTGRRSGQPHTTPLGYVQDADRYVVAASAGGAPDDPHWYRNVVAQPVVTVEVGAATHRAVASTVIGPERVRLFDRLAGALPLMAEYAQTCPREIPVVVLSPADA